MKSEPVDSVPSLQGKKIRISTSVASEALKTLGVVPISGSLGELREFLSRGVIDGTGISDELSTGFKVDKYIHEITQIPGGLYSNSAFLIINKDKWGQISKQDQAAIMAISGEQLSARMGRLWHENDQRSRQGLQHKLGSSYRIADETLLAAIDTAFEPARQNWYTAARKANVDGEAAMRFYQAQVSELAQQAELAQRSQ